MAIPMPSPTWILVTDASQARILEMRSLAGPLAAVPDFDMIAEDTHGFARDLKSDRPGRAFAGAGATSRSAMPPHHDPHQLAKDRFAKSVATQINRAFEAKRFAQLVVIAPPHALGILRQELDAAVREATAAEINKDLVKADRDDILEHVKAELA